MAEDQPDELTKDGFNGLLTDSEFLGWLTTRELEYQVMLEVAEHHD